MARATKTASAAPATTKAAGKVGKIDKAPKAPKAPKAEAEGEAKTKRASQYSTGKLKVTAAGKAATLRGGRQVRLDLVRSLDGKPMSEVYGAPYRLEGEDEDRTLVAANLALFVEKGFIEIV